MDKEIEIQRMHSSIIHTTESQQWIILQYGCGMKMCDSVLIRKSEDEIHSLPLSYGIFIDALVSPDTEKIMLIYGINEGNIHRNFLNIVTINEMNKFEEVEEDIQKEFIENPTWPFLNYSWLDHHHISLEIPDVASSDFSTLQDWYDSVTKKTRTLIIDVSMKEDGIK